ncbi:DUF6090 family protein [Gaetbulibacter aquiaggeris]|uniref:DUF6090 family protein n=1 Tax=Gaetbulibacter aquiaggeris TaxID=1735373 RepID=A0ABW7MSB6_9FLAO
MIPFFRKIRKTLADDNKPLKYFRYAIGEIVLVMVGILLALQVSNWNSDRKRNQLEKVLLAQVKDELSSTYSDIESDINLLELGIRSNFRISDYIQQNVSYNDTMCFDFYWLTKDEYIYPTASAYSRIKEEGLDIIRNDSIRRRLQGLYERGFPRISKDNPFHPDISAYFSDYYQNHFEPNSNYSLKFKAIFPSDTLKYPREYKVDGHTHYATIGFVPLDFETLKKDPKFKMLMKQTEVFRTYKLGIYSFTKNRIEQIFNLIDKELVDD